jgi:hypothetical protein
LNRPFDERGKPAKTGHPEQVPRPANRGYLNVGNATFSRGTSIREQSFMLEPMKLATSAVYGRIVA